MARRRSRPRAIGTVVGQVLGDLGLGAAQSGVRILERWPEIVGAEVARHSRPLAVRGEVLEAEVDSSVWCQQLQLDRERLLAALAEVIGPGAPTDLRLRVGYHRQSGRPDRPRPQRNP